jgi:DNA-binding CsgD family transcriptional regulator
VGLRGRIDRHTGGLLLVDGLSGPDSLPGSDAAIVFYQALRLSPQQPGAVDGLGLTPDERDAAWAELRRLQLVRPGETGELVPVEPEAAILRLLDQEVERVRRSEVAAAQLRQSIQFLSEQYGKLSTGGGGEVQVDLHTDHRRIQQALEDLTVMVQSEVVSMHPGPLPSTEVLRSSLDRDRRHLARGVAVRALYPRRLTSSPAAMEYLRELAEAGVDVRLCTAIPTHMIIGDERLALLPSDPHDLGKGAIVLRGVALVSSYRALYEYCWHTSAVFGGSGLTSASGALTEEQVLALRMLAAGMKDEKVARSLGVSLRTASRIVSGVMQALGAESRFQAGVKAAQLGWLG